MLLVSNKIPSPALRATSPTRGEVILSRKLNMNAPLPLWERSPFRYTKGRVRGLLTTAWILFSFLITPLCAQNFGTLVDELSGVEDEQVENEMPPPELPKAEEKPPPLLPSSNEIQATEAENHPAEDDFAPVKNIVTNGVTLQGLDKQTARVFIIDAHVGQSIDFGTLRLVVQQCEKAPLENRQESMAFIKITEQKANADPQILFSGWMFSSSPALSALDHPVYDVWVKECKVLDHVGDKKPSPKVEERAGH